MGINLIESLFLNTMGILEQQKIWNRISDMLIQKNLRLILAESMTSGAIASVISMDHLAGEYFLGSIVCYDDQVKTKILNVDKTLIEEFGGVSAEVTEAMCKGLQEIFAESDIQVSLTGFAFDSIATSKENPVGTVYINAQYAKLNLLKKYVLDGNDQHIKSKAVEQAFILIEELLNT